MGFFDFLEDLDDLLFETKMAVDSKILDAQFAVEEAFEDVVDDIKFNAEMALLDIRFAFEEIGDTFRCVVDAIINRDNLHAVAKEVKDNKAIQNAIKYIVKEKRDHIVTFDMLDENDEIVVDGIEVDGQGVAEDVYEGQEIYI